MRLVILALALMAAPAAAQPASVRMTAESYAGTWPFRLSEVEVVCARRTDGRREIGVRVTGGRIFGVNGLGRARWGDADPILAPGRSRFELTPMIVIGETLC